MIKNILLDLDDTLLDFHKAEAVALKTTLEKFGINPTAKTLARYSAINVQLWEALERGELEREEVLTQRFSILFNELGESVSSEKARDTYENLLGIGHYFIPGAPELLEDIHEKYSLYLVSNGTAAVQATRIESAKIAKYFKGMFISQNVGFNKPHIEFFSRCFAEIPNFCHEETVIIGDSLSSDIKGGNNAKIKTIWFNPAKKPQREGITVNYEISNLSALPPLLEQIGRE